MLTTKPYNTYTPSAQPRLYRHYLSHLNQRFAQVGQGQAAQYSLSAEHSKKVQNIVRRYVGAAGKTEAISLHFIRHTVGTNIALNEAPLLIFQRLLGHS